MDSTRQHYDFLVLGSGIAGLSFALRAAMHGSVAILTKKNSAESNTNYAQGGIASVMDPSDCLEAHVQDTLEAGAGLCHEEVVRHVIGQGPHAIRALVELGVAFSRNRFGDFDLGKEGGHSQRRVLHAGDMTGRVIEEALLHAAKTHPNIQIFEHHFAIDFITSHHLNIDVQAANRSLGAYVLDTAQNKVKVFTAAITLLATGGAGKVYLYTSNPDIATGDGVAMAWRARAAVANLEFVQFHPTCLFHPQAKSFLISEALRGEGGLLRLINGETFMERYDARRELAPRDIVARAIDHELKKRGEDFVLLDMTHLPASYLRERFPNISEQLKKFGYDLTAQPIPVVPAAHYMCGGVVVDAKAESSIRNLFICGEAAFTGLHGGNRLASNSLLEAVVYAEVAATEAVCRLRQIPEELPAIPDWDPGHAVDVDEAVVIKQNWDEIRQFMWNYVGVVRSNKRLVRAKKRIDLLREEIREYYLHFLVNPDLLELRNIACVAELIIRSALWRKESRGLHYNLDYPSPSDAYRCDTVLTPSTVL